MEVSQWGPGAESGGVVSAKPPEAGDSMNIEYANYRRIFAKFQFTVASVLVNKKFPDVDRGGGASVPPSGCAPG